MFLQNKTPQCHVFHAGGSSSIQGGVVDVGKIVLKNSWLTQRRTTNIYTRSPNV